MLYLYAGFVFIKTCLAIYILSNVSVATSALFFSMIVLFIWSFFPIIPYALGRVFNTKPMLEPKLLVILGLLIAIIEKGLFHFEILKAEQGTIGLVFSALSFFVIGLFSFSTPKEQINAQPV